MNINSWFPTIYLRLSEVDLSGLGLQVTQVGSIKVHESESKEAVQKKEARNTLRKGKLVIIKISECRYKFY